MLEISHPMLFLFLNFLILLNHFFSNFLRKVLWEAIFGTTSKNAFILILPLSDTSTDFIILELKIAFS